MWICQHGYMLCNPLFIWLYGVSFDSFRCLVCSTARASTPRHASQKKVERILIGFLLLKPVRDVHLFSAFFLQNIKSISHSFLNPNHFPPTPKQFLRFTPTDDKSLCLSWLVPFVRRCHFLSRPTPFFSLSPPYGLSTSVGLAVDIQIWRIGLLFQGFHWPTLLC